MRNSPKRQLGRLCRASFYMPKPLKNTICSDLIACIQWDAAQLLGSPEAAAIKHVKTLHNPYSETYLLEAQNKQSPLRIYVKIPHTSAAGAHIAKKRLLTEFNVMQALHQGSKAAKHGLFADVAQPLGYYPEYMALATVEAGTHTLRQHYRSAARLIYNGHSRELLLAEVKNAGTWLQKFQQHTLNGTGAFDATQFISYIKIRLEFLAQVQGINFSSTLANNVIAQVEKISGKIDPATHQIAGRHNDFASHNIIANQGKVRIIDFSMYDIGSSAYDPTYFWMDLEMLKLDPSYSRRFLSELQTEFLAHYGSISSDSLAFQLVRCQYSINRILTLHQNSMLPTPHNMYKKSVVTSCLSWIKKFASA